MSTETAPPAITSLKIPIIKKGEYDLWSMKMRQYIAITDNALWDVILNGNKKPEEKEDAQSSGAPKMTLTPQQLRVQEKALNILLSAIPDGHLLKFHDAKDAKELWVAIRTRFGGNEASKKMHRNMLKQQFQTFVVGERESLDAAYDRFQNLLSMLELYKAEVTAEDANLKFLRSLPSIWNVVATMIRGQPGLEKMDFDDLYNNLKVYEHEVLGNSNSSSHNIAFLSSETKNSTLKQSTGSQSTGAQSTGSQSTGHQSTGNHCTAMVPYQTPEADEVMCSFFV